MGEVIPFKSRRTAPTGKGQTLCRHGFHKWVVEGRPFDVKRGRLVTAYRCQRCGATKTEAR